MMINLYDTGILKHIETSSSSNWRPLQARSDQPLAPAMLPLTLIAPLYILPAYSYLYVLYEQSKLPATHLQLQLLQPRRTLSLLSKYSSYYPDECWHNNLKNPVWLYVIIGVVVIFIIVGAIIVLTIFKRRRLKR